MSKTAKKDEFRISKKRKKRKEKESGPKYAEEDEFGDFQGHEQGYDPVFDQQEPERTTEGFINMRKESRGHQGNMNPYEYNHYDNSLSNSYLMNNS